MAGERESTYAWSTCRPAMGLPARRSVMPRTGTTPAGRDHRAGLEDLVGVDAQPRTRRLADGTRVPAEGRRHPPLGLDLGLDEDARSARCVNRCRATPPNGQPAGPRSQSSAAASAPTRVAVHGRSCTTPWIACRPSGGGHQVWRPSKSKTPSSRRPTHGAIRKLPHSMERSVASGGPTMILAIAEAERATGARRARGRCRAARVPRRARSRPVRRHGGRELDRATERGDALAAARRRAGAGPTTGRPHLPQRRAIAAGSSSRHAAAAWTAAAEGRPARRRRGSAPGARSAADDLDPGPPRAAAAAPASAGRRRRARRDRGPDRVERPSSAAAAPS